MSAKMMGAVWELDLPAPKLLILLALADHADHDGANVFPRIKLTAWKTGYSERQVQRIIAALVKDRILQVVDARRGKTTIYRIDLSAGVKKSPLDGVRQNVTPDITVSPVPLTSDVTPTPDITVSPITISTTIPITKSNSAASKKEYDDVPKDDRLQIIRAWAEALSAPPIGAYKREANHSVAAEIFRAGYRAPQVALFVKTKRTDNFWRDKTLTLAKVAELMPEWLMNLKAAPTVPREVISRPDAVPQEWGINQFVREAASHE